MQSKDKTIHQYIDELPADRKEVVIALRKAILKNIPKGFEETMSYGMIGYVVPHTLYPDGYHCEPSLPVPFMNIASQKNHIAVYHMALYDGQLQDWFKSEWEAHSSKKLDMGKCCIRFKRPEYVTVDLIGELASKLTPKQWIKIYEKNIKTVRSAK